jgi:hypothetical protein
MRRGRPALALALLLALLPALPAARAAAAAGAAELQLHLLTVYAHDSGFEAPSRVPSGPTTLRFLNKGWKPHRMQILRLADGVDEEALRAALPLGDTAPAGITSLGGTGVHRAEGSEEVSVALRPGRYALVCDVHDGPAEIHEIEVLRYEDAALPPGDWSALLEDGDVRAPGAVPAGARWLRVENRGTRLAGLGIGRLRPGRSAADARSWVQAPSGPRPWVRVGGTAPISPGEALLVEMPLASGDYVLFAPSEADEARADGFWHALAVRRER